MGGAEARAAHAAFDDSVRLSDSGAYDGGRGSTSLKLVPAAQDGSPAADDDSSSPRVTAAPDEDRLNYFAQLALEGMDPERNPEENPALVRRVADVMMRLHTPKTPVWLETDNRLDPLRRRAYAIGSVAAGTRLSTITSHVAGFEHTETIVVVKTSTIRGGERRRSDVSIEDILHSFDPRHFSDDTRPFIAVGQEKVREQIEKLFWPATCLPELQRGQQEEQRAGAFAALVRSGTRAADLGIDKEKIQERRNRVLESLEVICEEDPDSPEWDKLYEGDILQLPPLCRSNWEALSIVQQMLGPRRAPDIGDRFFDDYALLVDYQGRSVARLRLHAEQAARW